MPVQEKIVVALGVPSAEAALQLAQELHGRVGMFKDGSEVFTAEGPALARELVAAGEHVFLDLKLHDIRKACGAHFLIVTPGVRPVTATLDAQTRVATPAATLHAADYLVIGRPIIGPPDPAAAADAIAADMERARVAIGSQG